VGLGKTGWFVRENHVFTDGTRQKSGFLDQNPSPVNKKFRVSGGQGRVSRGFLEAGRGRGVVLRVLELRV